MSNSEKLKELGKNLQIFQNLVEDLITKCPTFEGDVELAAELGKSSANVLSAFNDLKESMLDAR